MFFVRLLTFKLQLGDGIECEDVRRLVGCDPIHVLGVNGGQPAVHQCVDLGFGFCFGNLGAHSCFFFKEVGYRQFVSPRIKTYGSRLGVRAAAGLQRGGGVVPVVVTNPAHDSSILLTTERRQVEIVERAQQQLAAASVR